MAVRQSPCIQTRKEREHGLDMSVCDMNLSDQQLKPNTTCPLFEKPSIVTLTLVKHELHSPHTPGAGNENVCPREPQPGGHPHRQTFSSSPVSLPATQAGNAELPIQGSCGLERTLPGTSGGDTRGCDYSDDAGPSEKRKRRHLAHDRSNHTSTHLTRTVPRMTR